MHFFGAGPDHNHKLRIVDVPKFSTFWCQIGSRAVAQNQQPLNKILIWNYHLHALTFNCRFLSKLENLTDFIYKIRHCFTPDIVALVTTRWYIITSLIDRPRNVVKRNVLHDAESFTILTSTFNYKQYVPIAFICPCSRLNQAVSKGTVVLYSETKKLQRTLGHMKSSTLVRSYSIVQR